jgi:hypothetical protein
MEIQANLSLFACLSAVVLAMAVVVLRMVGQSETPGPSISMAWTIIDSKEGKHAQKNWKKPTP